MPERHSTTPDKPGILRIALITLGVAVFLLLSISCAVVLINVSGGPR